MTVRVCFVCLGNICRSPTAEGIMQHLVRQAGLDDQIEIDSAGTSSHHEGEAADERSRETARRRGFELTSRGRQFQPRDFDRFDYVVAMDQSNRRNLMRIARTDDDKAKVSLLRDFDRDAPEGSEVPDPYYGGPSGFEDVFDLCEAACQGLLDDIRTRL